MKLDWLQNARPTSCIGDTATHFKFFALLFMAAMLILTGCTFNSNVSKKVLNVHVSSKDEDIREQLLAYTPIGSDGTNVLKFVVDDLKPQWGVSSYYEYVRALQVGRNVQLNVTPINPDVVLPLSAKRLPREIYVTIGTYLGGEYYWRLDATWTFDKNDKLVSIDIGRWEEH